MIQFEIRHLIHHPSSHLGRSRGLALVIIFTQSAYQVFFLSLSLSLADHWFAFFVYFESKNTMHRLLPMSTLTSTLTHRPHLCLWFCGLAWLVSFQRMSPCTACTLLHMHDSNHQFVIQSTFWSISTTTPTIHNPKRHPNVFSAPHKY